MSRRSEEMQRVLAEFEQSGQSLRAFGQSKGIAYAKLLYWRKKLKAEGLPNPSLAPVVVIPDSSPTETSGGAYEVWLPNGVSLGVPRGFDDCELLRLAQVLAQC